MDNDGLKSIFSFSVSKKVSKSAVVRNKLRRRGYSVIESNISNIKPEHFLFFSYKKGGEKVSYKELENNVVGLLEKSFMLK